MSVQVVQTMEGPRDVFVDDVVARAPTWLLVSTRWHFFYSTGVTACGGVYNYASVGQHFRPHTKRHLYERTITRLCERCRRAAPEPEPQEEPK